MTDYISRADAIEHLKNVKVSYPHADISLPIDLAINAIEMLPSAEAVQVVRCKDCIYYETCNLSSSHWWKGGYTVDIEFCSFGERREP